MKRRILTLIALAAMALSLAIAEAATEVEIEQAIVDGLVWLAANQNVDGSWPYYAGDYMAPTGLALLKFCHRAWELGYSSPFDPAYPYHQNVEDGFVYMFDASTTRLLTVNLTLQDHTASATGTMDDPDVNGNGIGVYAHGSSAYTLDVYDTGIMLAAISAANTPTRVVNVPGSVVHGRQFGDIAQDLVDWLAWAQSDYNCYVGIGAGEGGWSYGALDNDDQMGYYGPDNSNSGYAVLGLSYGKAFGSTIPTWVEVMLNAYVTDIQDPVDGDMNGYDGGSWYDAPSPPGTGIIPNILKTGNLIQEMALVGDSPTTPRVVDALDYLARHWGDASGANYPPGWTGRPAQYQSMFTAMKGLEYMGVDDFSGIDWYADFADTIVSQQDKGANYGSWQTSSGRGTPTLITTWALLTLERTVPPRKPVIKIEKTHDTHQGHYEFISITIEERIFEMGGFDFLIAYDASALTFMEATPGQLLEDCGWEYFTYRYGWQGNCEGPCPSGLLRIVAIADINNGPNHPSCYGPPDTDPHELAELKFYATNDRTFNCMYVPIRFFWHDCGDNTVSNMEGDVLYLSDHVYDFEGNEITGDIHYGGHWWLDGPPYPVDVPNDACQNDDPEKPDAIPFIDFIHGGIDIICSDSIDAPGDINLNDIPNEVADAVLFTNYFIHGYGVFDINPAGQVAATDVNNDGRVLTVGDLVYLIRIITGDALPFPRLSPFAHDALANVAVNHSAACVSTKCDAGIGAGYFVLEHRGYGIGEPYLIDGASGMTLKYSDDNGVLKVLIYSMEKDVKIAAGDRNVFVIPISGEGTIRLREIELSDYHGNLLTVEKGIQPTVPNAFTLHQNYPNPFNATTSITYELPTNSHVKIEIFNVMGQHVSTLVDRDELPGVHTIEWNGLDASGQAVASGVYLYRLTARNITTEKKMILMK